MAAKVVDMENIIQLAPNKWVTKAVLMAVTAMRPGTIKRARDKAWMQERQYLLFSPERVPGLNSQCMYKGASSTKN